jgi:hypothetical protein
MNTGCRLTVFWLASFGLALWGCFIPPHAPAPASRGDTVTLALPYDLAWQTVQQVIKRQGYKITAEDPNEGIIEAQAAAFAPADADCGSLNALLRSYAANPTAVATAVYNFRLTAESGESTAVSVKATFTTPVKAPLRHVTGVSCASRGTQEARLLDQIVLESAGARRPSFAPPQAQ